jgi:Tfp pilus assembly protein PilF
MKSGENKWRWLSALAFLAACFSKEMAVTLPVVIVLLMYQQGRFQGGRLDKSLMEIAPLFVAGAIYIVVRLAALGFISTTHLDIAASVVDWFTLGLRVFGQYIRYSLVPYPLTAYHLIPLHLSDRMLSTLLYTLLIGVAVVAALALDRKVRGVALWSMIFAVMLVPVFNFKGISLTFFAERYLYIPTLSISVVIGLLLSKSTTNLKIAFSVLVAVFAISTLVRTKDWASDESLYASILGVQPEVAHIRNNLADIYIKRGDDAGAKNNLEAALRSLNDKVYVQAENEKYRALVGLGAVEARAKQYSEAKVHFKQALEINPRGDWAYLYMGGVLMEGEGNIEQAMNFFRKAIDLGPVNEVARDYMGIALFNLKRNQEAVRYFQEALTINPTYKDAQVHLDMATQASLHHSTQNP